MTEYTRGKTAERLPAEADSPLTLAAGPYWPSFEKLRVQGAGALNQIEPGTVGTLASQGGQFRVLREEDFQRLVGLAREVDRVRRGLRVVLAAVRTVREHPGQSSVNTLVEAALLLGESPVLPTRRQFEALLPEHGSPAASAPKPDDDEVELDPEAVRRPYEDAREAARAA